MKTIKVDKNLVLSYYGKWDANDLPQYVQVHKITGERSWRWNENDVTDAMYHYETKYFDYCKIRWV